MSRPRDLVRVKRRHVPLINWSRQSRRRDTSVTPEQSIRTRALVTNNYRRCMHPRLATVHGVYYLVTGLWPLLSMRTFEWVTGPKTDRWLVRMVGLLAAVIGASLLARRRSSDRILPVGSALAFASVDTTYSLRGAISRIYLADALLELALVAGWLRRNRTGR
jgi:hypothetical protein